MRRLQDEKQAVTLIRAVINLQHRHEREFQDASLKFRPREMKQSKAKPNGFHLLIIKNQTLRCTISIEKDFKILLLIKGVSVKGAPFLIDLTPTLSKAEGESYIPNVYKIS